MDNKKRCKWCNLKNSKYIKYHNNEWGKTNFDDKYLYEMLILESFQTGLSWECVLNKRESFRKAYDNFELEKVCLYDNEKILELLNNKDIIRNKLKINASINNSKIFKEIVNEYGSFHEYLKIFTKDKIIYEIDKTINDFKEQNMRKLNLIVVFNNDLEKVVFCIKAKELYKGLYNFAVMCIFIKKVIYATILIGGKKDGTHIKITT